MMVVMLLGGLHVPSRILIPLHAERGEAVGFVLLANMLAFLLR